MSKKKSNKISEFLKGICLILLLIAVILGINVYLTKLNTQDTVEEQFYQYFGGVKTEYDGVMSITKKGEITELRTKEGAINFVCKANENLKGLVDSGELVKDVSKIAEGNGGGSPTFAQGGGTRPDKLDIIESYVKSKLVEE